MSNKKPDCGCLFSLFPCLYTLTPEDALSKEIDRGIARDKKEFNKTHRLLLLGAGESGKSTIIKQMQLIHVDKFSETVRRQRRDDIRNNLLEAVVSILRAMASTEIQLENSEHEIMAKWILDHAMKNDFDYPKEFYTYTSSLWKDKGVQKVFERSNEYQLIDSAKYFLDKVDIIGEDSYMPTDQDILRCRVLTTGIYELNFQVKNVNFQIIDVGGQRDERRKWFLCFNGVTAIIFVSACSSYDMALREDPSKNRLRESLDLFKIVWRNRWLDKIPVILFLNKQDLFREKVISGRRKLGDYFEEFNKFKTNESEPDEHPEVARAKHFIKKQFEDIFQDNSNPLSRCCYRHFTCAVDTENIKRVFDSCRDHIQRKHLIENDLI